MCHAVPTLRYASRTRVFNTVYSSAAAVTSFPLIIVNFGDFFPPSSNLRHMCFGVNVHLVRVETRNALVLLFVAYRFGGLSKRVVTRNTI